LSTGGKKIAISAQGGKKTDFGEMREIGLKSPRDQKTPAGSNKFGAMIVALQFCLA